MKSNILMGMVFVLSTAGTVAAEADVERRVDELIGKMTEAEKIGQLNMQPMKGYRLKNEKIRKECERQVRSGEIGSLIWAHTMPKERNRWQRIAVCESRLGIPLFFAHDIIHGSYTTMPIAPALAGSFDMDLIERAQAVAAKEAAAEGLDLVFAPMCDIARDQRWGRVAESCGEDPYLAACAVAAQVRGFQGADPAASDRVGSCCKHFVGYGMVTGGQDYRDSLFSEWDLRQTHLPSFRAGVEAGTVSLMSGFNTIDGMPAVASRHALTDILRGEWGFRGFVVSDWGTAGELVNWGVADNPTDAARMAVAAGNDIDMCSGTYVKGIKNAIASGALPVSVLDEAVRRVLRVKFKLGLFDRPYVDENLFATVTNDTWTTGLAVAREAADKSIVLLKNDGTLPLNGGNVRRIALIGPFGDSAVELCGSWGGHSHGARFTTVFKGLRNAFPKNVIKRVKGCEATTKPVARRLQDGSSVVDKEALMKSERLDLEESVTAAEWSDCVIMAIGQHYRYSGEAASVSELQFTGRQLELFRAVAATGKKIVSVVFGGRPVYDREVWERSSAVLFAWNPGCGGGQGVADILSGAVSPSARLSMSFPRSLAQSPVYYNVPVTGRPGMGNYTDVAESGPVHPFGFGLTFSKFEYGPVAIRDNAAICEIANVGEREATEVVQLYVRQHACEEGYRPCRELRGFERVSLAPGANREVRFELTERTLGYTDRTGRDRCDPGRYSVWIAPDAASGTPAAYVFAK